MSKPHREQLMFPQRTVDVPLTARRQDLAFQSVHKAVEALQAQLIDRTVDVPESHDARGPESSQDSVDARQRGGRYRCSQDSTFQRIHETVWAQQSNDRAVVNSEVTHHVPGIQKTELAPQAQLNDEVVDIPVAQLRKRCRSAHCSENDQ